MTGPERDARQSPEADPYEIVPVSDVDANEIVAALALAFDRDDFTEAWYRWKHIECPFGPSHGWVARDDDGIVGVRLFTRWPWLTSSGAIEGMRAMDGGVVPRARRQGVFQTLVRTEMDVREREARPLIALSTSVPASRAAYVKLGWCPLGVVNHTMGLVVGRRARLQPWVPVPGSAIDPTASALVRTDWTDESLRWRFDQRAGHRYESVQLDQADGPNGLTYRVIAQRGLRLLVVEHLVGGEADARRLVQAAARDERAFVALSVSGVGAEAGPGLGPLSRQRGASTLTSWSVAVPEALEIDELASWGLALADLEGVL